MGPARLQPGIGGPLGCGVGSPPGRARAAIIASVPEDEESVAEALDRHPERFAGFFMVDPTRRTAAQRVNRAVTELGLRCACLFPGMHGFELSDPRVLRLVERLAAVPGTALFVHCGVFRPDRSRR